MPVLLAAPLVLVAFYCLVRVVAPRLGGRSGEHRRDVDAWHVLMASAMAAMLAGVLSRPVAVASLAVAVAALCWGVLAVERPSGGASHARLVVGAAAMAVMSLALAGPASANARHGATAMGGTSAGSSSVLVVLLLGALAVVAAARLPVAAGRSAGVVRRLDAGCDVVMAGAMAVMLASLL